MTHDPYTCQDCTRLHWNHADAEEPQVNDRVLALAGFVLFLVGFFIGNAL